MQCRTLQLTVLHTVVYSNTDNYVNNVSEGKIVLLRKIKKTIDKEQKRDQKTFQNALVT